MSNIIIDTTTRVRLNSLGSSESKLPDGYVVVLNSSSGNCSLFLDGKPVWFAVYLTHSESRSEPFQKEMVLKRDQWIMGGWEYTQKIEMCTVQLIKYTISGVLGYPKMENEKVIIITNGYQEPDSYDILS